MAIPPRPFPQFPQPSFTPVNVASTDNNVPAVQGTSLTSTDRFALLGGGPGVVGQSGSGTGVAGTSNSGVGVVGTSTSNWGVSGQSTSGTGVVGESDSNFGVAGVSTSNTGVKGTSNSGVGVVGVSQTNDAINGTSSSPQNAGVSANNTAPSGGKVPSGFGLWASSNNTAIYGQGKPAGYFNGDVEVTGDVKLVGADCAEHFDVVDASACGPGTVMVIDDSGALVPSCQEYDRRVAGVVSGAGDLRPGLILGHQVDGSGRQPIALVGKVYCKVDATYGPIEVGDLLTTSPTPGHAMKASDPLKAFGAVIGKALRPLHAGQGLLPILVTLQ